MAGLDSIGISGFNFGIIFQLIYRILFWVIGIGGFFAIAYFTVFKKLLYKDIIEVWDVTGNSVIVRKDRGRWRENKKSGIGTYLLLRDKHAKLKKPPKEHALFTVKGNNKYTFIKFGEGHFDYVSIPPNFDPEKFPEPIALADFDWAKGKVREAAAKNTLAGWFNEHKSEILFITAIVMVMIIMWGMFKAIPETIGSAVAPVVEGLDNNAAAFDRLAGETHALIDRVIGTREVPELPPNI